MRSQSSIWNTNPHGLSHLGFHPSHNRIYLPATTRVSCASSPRRIRPNSDYASELTASSLQRYGCTSRYSPAQVNAMDEDSVGSSALDDWDNDWGSGYMLSSSDGEDSDGEFLVNPVADVDLPSMNDKLLHSDEALRVTAHRLAMFGQHRKKNRSRHGFLNNVGLITFLMLLLLLVDSCAWRIVRLPLAPFYLTRPFLISGALTSCLGYICIPLLDSLKIHQIPRTAGPARNYSNRRTPTMGGLFFVPIGIVVAEVIVGFSSTQLSAAAVVTLAFAVIGLLDDAIAIMKNRNCGLSAWMRLILQVAVATWFSFWLDTASISSPYGMKMLIPLPAPLGLIYVGKYYLFLTSFCFVSMGNGIKLTDGLDGLAAGTAGLAFTGMAIAVLPLCADLAVFGASMAGACIGFLLHNQYKASVFMGDTGTFALGGALAAMAACTGMFFPSFVSSGIFVLEVFSVMMQVLYFKTTKHFLGTGRPLFRKVPFHHHLVLCGIREPIIVAGAYVISCVLALAAGYTGLVSA